MTEDQGFAARRPDLLVFQGAPQEEEFSTAGPVELDLWVSTSAAVVDWIVKLIDVSPGKLGVTPVGFRGHRQIMVRGEPSGVTLRSLASGLTRDSGPRITSQSHDPNRFRRRR
ncbi:hypothetical protein IV102_10200 [bacterium]|nr:hypothetical protein [bacterium]